MTSKIYSNRKRLSVHSSDLHRQSPSHLHHGHTARNKQALFGIANASYFLKLVMPSFDRKGNLVLQKKINFYVFLNTSKQPPTSFLLRESSCFSSILSHKKSTANHNSYLKSSSRRSVDSNWSGKSIQIYKKVNLISDSFLHLCTMYFYMN